MKFFGKAFSLFTWILLAYLLYQRVTIWQKESRQEGLAVQASSFQILNQDGSLRNATLTEGNKRKVIVFWATWCGPCTVELARVRSLAEKNEIPADSFIAISSFEDPDVVFKTVKERKYTFPIGIDRDGDLAKEFQISGTPTTVFLEDGKIKSVSQGLTLLLEQKLKGFF